MTYKVRQSKLKRALSVFPVILSARHSARVRTPDMERIINFIKKGKNVILAWDYYGRGKPLPHNDDVKQKRLVKSKLKRAHSVIHVIQSEAKPKRGIPNMEQVIILNSRGSANITRHKANITRATARI